MREHMGLYRGKRLDNGERVEGTPFFARGCCKLITAMAVHPDFVDEGNVYYAEGYPVDPETVGECTGLRDKNGKLIFEGDVVKCEHTVRFANKNEDYSKIRYSYGGILVETTPDELVACFGQSFEYRYLRNYVIEYYRGNLRLRNKSCTQGLGQSYIINHNIEIIGNIHDNPELLKGGEGE